MTLAIALVQRALLPEPSIAPFVFFYFGVAVESWLAGRWPGIITAVLSAAVGNYAFVAPFGAWSLSGPALTATALFLFTATATALLCGSLRDAMRSAEQAASELRHSQLRWQSLYQHSPTPLLEQDVSAVAARFAQLRSAGVTDLDKHLRDHPDEIARLALLVRVTEMSRSTFDIFRVERAEALPRDLSAYLDEESLAVFAREMAALWAGRRSFEAEMPMREPSGARRFLALRLSVLPGHETTLARVLVSFVDLTERREMEETLRRSERELREGEEALRDADRRKDEFLAVLSHELRNPLAPIRNGLHILEHAAPGGDQARHALAIIARQVGHLTRLVDDLLDATRISSGKIQLQ